MSAVARVRWLRIVAAAACAATISCSGSSAGVRAPSSSTSAASSTGETSLQSGTQDVTYTVDGVPRTAIVAVPSDVSHAAPVVFVFHGHGGSGRDIQHSQQIERVWPEAVVVYPDGLTGHPGKLDVQGTESGWQSDPGELGDRDLHMFDVMLESLQSSLPIDRARIYVMGHSNGSQFASLVLNQRPGEIAASANLSTTPNRYLPTDPVRSMFFAMGTEDPLVPIARQEAAIPLAEQHLDIDPASAVTNGDVTTEHTTNNSDVELEYVVYDGGHEPPPEIPGLVVDFFQRNPLSGR